jgi:dipeptidyl-peptidase-3
MCYYLKNAAEYTANETQRKMVEKYIESYMTGSIETHKDSQR